MKRTITLTNNYYESTTFEIDDFEHVICIVVYVLSGSEYADIIYDDRTIKQLSSCEYRPVDLAYLYIRYIQREINHVNDNVFGHLNVVYVRNEFDYLHYYVEDEYEED